VQGRRYRPESIVVYFAYVTHSGSYLDTITDSYDLGIKKLCFVAKTIDNVFKKCNMGEKRIFSIKIVDLYI